MLKTKDSDIAAHKHFSLFIPIIQANLVDVVKNCIFFQSVKIWNRALSYQEINRSMRTTGSEFSTVRNEFSTVKNELHVLVSTVKNELSTIRNQFSTVRNKCIELKPKLKPNFKIKHYTIFLKKMSFFLYLLCRLRR